MFGFVHAKLVNFYFLSQNNTYPYVFFYHNISIFLVYLMSEFLKPLVLWCQIGHRAPITGV